MITLFSVDQFDVLLVLENEVFKIVDLFTGAGVHHHVSTVVVAVIVQEHQEFMVLIDTVVIKSSFIHVFSPYVKERFKGGFDARFLELNVDFPRGVVRVKGAWCSQDR